MYWDWPPRPESNFERERRVSSNRRPCARRGPGRRGWFVVGRLFPLIKCFQRVASRKISVSGLFPRQRGTRGWPSNDVPFPSWPGSSRLGLPANPGLLTPEMAHLAGAPISVLHRAKSKLWAPFSATAQRRVLVILAARRTESRAVSGAPVYHILWVRGFRAHTISRPGFNLFKPLRRHFRATPFCRQPLARDPTDRNASVRSARLPPPGRRSAAKVDIEVSDCFMTRLDQITTIALSY
jgi:hypothetical protein